MEGNTSPGITSGNPPQQTWATWQWRDWLLSPYTGIKDYYFSWTLILTLVMVSGVIFDPAALKHINRPEVLYKQTKGEPPLGSREQRPPLTEPQRWPEFFGRGYCQKRDHSQTPLRGQPNLSHRILTTQHLLHCKVSGQVGLHELPTTIYIRLILKQGPTNLSVNLLRTIGKPILIRVFSASLSFEISIVQSLCGHTPNPVQYLDFGDNISQLGMLKYIKIARTRGHQSFYMLFWRHHKR